jgi:hypothetical protein
MKNMRTIVHLISEYQPRRVTQKISLTVTRAGWGPNGADMGFRQIPPAQVASRPFLKEGMRREFDLRPAA